MSFNVLTVKYSSSAEMYNRQTSCTLALSLSGLSSADGSVELREREREREGGIK